MLALAKDVAQVAHCSLLGRSIKIVMMRETKKVKKICGAKPF
jgi:hypothetical protein